MKRSIIVLKPKNSLNAKRKNFKTPLLKELSRSSQDSFELESDSKESRDDRLNSLKCGYSEFLDFLVSDMRGSDMAGSEMFGSEMSGSEILGSEMSGSEMSGSEMLGSEMSGSEMSGSEISGLEMSGSGVLKFTKTNSTPPIRKRLP